VTGAVSTAERLAAELSRAILKGTLLPGEPVRQDEWAERLGVSKVPVREALKLLVARQLISYQPNRGYFVAKMDAGELAQIYEIRGFLEDSLLRQIRWPTKRELKGLVDRSERVMSALNVGDIATTIEEDRGFFFALFDLSTLDVFVREAKHYWTLCDQYRAAGVVSVLVGDPQAERLRERRRRLLDALAQEDNPKLVAAVAELRESLLANLSRVSMPENRGRL